MMSGTCFAEIEKEFVLVFEWHLMLPRLTMNAVRNLI